MKVGQATLFDSIFFFVLFFVTCVWHRFSDSRPAEICFSKNNNNNKKLFSFPITCLFSSYLDVH